MSTILNSIIYYQDHEATLLENLEHLIAAAAPESGDIPAFTFATLVSALENDHSKAVTVAAMALMRLGAEKAAAS